MIVNNMNTEKLRNIGRINGNTETISLLVVGAIANIRHEQGEDILVNATNSDNWRITNESITQLVHQNQQSNNFVQCGSGSNSINVSGNNNCVFSGISGSVTVIGGRTIVAAGNSVNDATKGFDTESGEVDVIEIVVPRSYRGRISIKSSGDSIVNLDGWKGGAVTILDSGRGKYAGGSFEELDFFKLESSGAGTYDFDQIESNLIVVEKTGTAIFQANKIKAPCIDITQVGKGTIRINEGICKSTKVTSIGAGTISLLGEFGAISKTKVGNGIMIIE